MDNSPFRESLREGIAALGESLAPSVEEALATHFALLLQWNARVNLTAITDPREAAEKHFLDALALLPELEGAGSLLDLGSGAGFPGIPLKVARPALRLQLVDAVAKKVGFLKQVLATLALPDATARHVRAEGRPETEGLTPADRVTARAVASLDRLLPWVRPYLAPGGRFVGTLGPAESEGAEATARSVGWEVKGRRDYALPLSGARRVVVLLCPV